MGFFSFYSEDVNFNCIDILKMISVYKSTCEHCCLGKCMQTISTRENIF